MEHISMNAWFQIGLTTVSAIILTIVLIKEHYERKRERNRTAVVPATFDPSDEDRHRCTDMVLVLFDILMCGSKDKVFRLGKYQLTEIVEEPVNGAEEE